MNKSIILKLLILTISILFLLCSCKKVPNKLKMSTGRTWEQIKKSGRLRVLTVTPFKNQSLPRYYSPEYWEKSLLENVAGKLGLNVDYVYVKEQKELLPALLKNKGDIIVNYLPEQKSWKELINYTQPIAKTNDQIVTSTNNEASSLQDLSKKTIHISKQSNFLHMLKQLKRTIPESRLCELQQFDIEDLLYETAKGTYAFTIAESSFINNFNQYQSGLKTIYEFPERTSIAWGVRKDAKKLLEEINKILKWETTAYQQELSKNDWETIKKRKLLRVITRNSFQCYYIDTGNLQGFEYELLKKFADQHGLQLLMIIPPSWDMMFDWLRAGKGDLIAANVSISNLERTKGLTFSEPYMGVNQLLITRNTTAPIKSLKDLEKRKIYIIKSTTYSDTLQKLIQKGIKLNVTYLPPEMEFTEILEKVSKGEYDITMIDDALFKFAKLSYPNLKQIFRIKKRDYYGWITRQDNESLLRAINNFLKEPDTKLFIKSKCNKYFHNRDVINQKRYFPGHADYYRVSSYDDIIKKHAKERELPWCLIAAIIFEESQFDPNKKNINGDIGFMQLTPRILYSMNCDDPLNPEENVKVGIQYLDKLRQKVRKHTASNNDALAFLLACYRGGYGHFLDACHLADELGLDQSKWKGNIEKAYKMLANQKYSAKARFGNCDGVSIIQYVDNVMLHYNHYLQQEEQFSNQKLKNIPHTNNISKN